MLEVVVLFYTRLVRLTDGVKRSSANAYTQLWRLVQSTLLSTTLAQGSRDRYDLSL